MGPERSSDVFINEGTKEKGLDQDDDVSNVYR